MASGLLRGLVSGVGAVLAFHLPSSLSAVQAQGWAFGEDLGNFRIPRALQWKVPKSSARPGLLFSACGPFPAYKALETTRTTIRRTVAVIFVGCLIPGSSRELRISTNNPPVMNTSGSEPQLSVTAKVHPNSAMTGRGFGGLSVPFSLFQTRKLRLREGKRLTQGHAVGDSQGRWGPGP